jgi:hypothetical protein
MFEATMHLMDAGTIGLFGFGGAEIGAIVGWFQRAIQDLPQPRYVCACMAACAVAGAGAAALGQAISPTHAALRATGVPALVRPLGPGPVQMRGAPSPVLQASK